MAPVRLVSVAVASLVVAGLAAVATPATAVSPNAVIGQVYGGGGNSGAPYQNDFVEVFNRGTSPVSLAGWSVQYTSATGTGNFGSATNLITPISGTLAPGQYLLVQEAAGAGNGVPLPTPDVTDSTPINMSATGGKVALVNTTTPLGCNGNPNACSPAALATIVDLIGWDGANFFEGASAAPTTANTTSDSRAQSGCQDTDSNGADFTVGAPGPRNTASALHPCNVDQPPAVASTTPGSGATNVAVNANLSVTFTEPVDVSGAWFSIGCAFSGSHPAAVSGGPVTFSLDPSSDFANSESCTATIVASQVTDQDTDDPPDAMAANFVWSFTTEAPPPPPVPIHDIQDSSHRSPLASTPNTPGIVTARSTNGFWMEAPQASWDGSDATSEGIFVFTSSSPSVNVGDSVRVSGTVQEFRPGGASTGNLSTTEIGGSPVVTLLSSGNPLPPPVVIGTGGRMPPTENIDDDATGSVETSGTFDPATDGIDFYESLEGMRVQLNDPVATGPTATAFGETPVVPDNGAWATIRTPRGGVLLRPNDGNPERLVLDDLLVPYPAMNVGDHFNGALVGVLDYNFGNFFLELTSNPVPPLVNGGLARESTTPAGTDELAVSTMNVENLDPGDGSAKFAALADEIVNHMRSPDLISVEEVQDNNGATDNGVVDASTTITTLINAIQAAGGPTYSYRVIDPVNDQDGGEPGGNIRPVFLFRTDRGLAFVDRPGGTSTNSNAVTGSGAATQLLYSPGRIDPNNSAWSSSRKPLAGEFTYNGHKLFAIANHFNSKGGDDPLMGRFQPPTRSSEVQRHQQAQIVNAFVDSILAADSDADVVVMGDLNDFEFSDTLHILEGQPSPVLVDLLDGLPQNERYSYDFEGNSQSLDHLLVSNNLDAGAAVTDDVVHVNSEFFDGASDHDPEVAHLSMPAATMSATASPAPNGAGWNASPVTVTFTCTDPLHSLAGPCPAPVTLSSDGAGQSVSRSVPTKSGTTVSASVTGINIDQTAPSLAGARLSPPNGNGWSNGPVTVEFACDDGTGSGVASLTAAGAASGGSASSPLDVQVTGEGANQSVTGACSDVAGNAATPATVGGISIDLHAPSVAVTGVTDGATYTLGSVPAAGCATQDPLSGVAQAATVSVSGGTPNGVGTFTATCSGARDLADNASPAVSATYQVGYAGVSGFMQPINPDNTSVFHRSKAVPAKLRLAGDEFFGFDTSGWSIQRVSVSCSAMGTDLTVESVGSNTPFTTFRYDASTDQYVYNADFHDVALGSCWKLRATLDSGQAVDSAVFQIGK